jgi:cell division protein FtsN
MTNYSRSAIPGRPAGTPGGRDLDRLVFGDPPAEEARSGRSKAAEPHAEADEAEADDDLAPIRPFVERAPRDRRAGSDRRRESFSQLPGRQTSEPDDSRRGLILLVGAILVIAVFGGAVWNAYRGGVRAGEDAAIPQLADAGPFKERPEPSEQPKTDTLDASVFERIEGPAPSSATGEQIAASPAATAPAAASPSPVASAPAQPVSTTPQGETRPVAPAAAPSDTPAAAPAVVAVAAARAATQAPASAPASGRSGGFDPAGRFVVQIGASTTEAGADQEWARWASRAGDLMSGGEKYIVRADVGGRTVYRVRVGSFATAEDADGFCAAFKGMGGDCFRATR